MFRSIPIYFKIYADKIEITNLGTGESLSKRALKKFSSSRMLIADYDSAEELSRSILKELGLSKRSLKILIQQMKIFEGGLCGSEKRILHDLGKQIGGDSVTIITNDKVLSSEEAIEILKEV